MNTSSYSHGRTVAAMYADKLLGPAVLPSTMIIGVVPFAACYALAMTGAATVALLVFWGIFQPACVWWTMWSERPSNE